MWPPHFPKWHTSSNGDNYLANPYLVSKLTHRSPSLFITLLYIPSTSSSFFYPNKTLPFTIFYLCLFVKKKIIILKKKMKGEHVVVEDVKHTNTPSSPSMMFSTFHHPQYHLQQHQCHHHQTEEENSPNSGGGGGGGGVIVPVGSPDDRSIVIKKIKTIQSINSSGSGGGNDGASIEVARRPRGRPPGSKNKPKPPIIITREAECAMRPHVIEIPSGIDIVDSLSRFARQRNIGLCVLNASGSVANVCLRQPNTTPGTTVTIHGRFDILSIAATHLPPTPNNMASPTPSGSCSSGFANLTISLAGPNGQIFGGSVVGGLVAAGTVFVVATSFTNPSYHRLPIEEDCPTGETAGSSEGGGGGESGVVTTPVGSCGLSTYSFQMPSDVIWTPTARQPPTPQPPQF